MATGKQRRTIAITRGRDAARRHGRGEKRIQRISWLTEQRYGNGYRTTVLLYRKMKIVVEKMLSHKHLRGIDKHLPGLAERRCNILGIARHSFARRSPH